jgi:hypothetical protein
MLDQKVRLAPGHMLCVQDGEKLNVFVQQGQVIITQEHDPDDVEVAAGAAFRIRRPGKTIVMARRESTVWLALASAGSRAPRVLVKKYVGPCPVVLHRLEWPRCGAQGALRAIASLLARWSRAW